MRKPENAVAERLEERKKLLRKGRRSKKIKKTVVIILVILVVIIFAGRNIIKLKTENARLQKEQTELKKERDALKETFKKTDEREFIQEEARKKLRLLKPGEIMFIFKDEDKKENADK